MATTVPDRKVYCNDGCKRGVEPEELESSGWQWLPITNRYRCVECWRSLKKANEDHHANRG